MDYYKKEEVRDNRKQIDIEDSELIAIVELTLKTVIIQMVKDCFDIIKDHTELSKEFKDLDETAMR